MLEARIAELEAILDGVETAPAKPDPQQARSPHGDSRDYLNEVRNTRDPQEVNVNHKPAVGTPTASPGGPTAAGTVDGELARSIEGLQVANGRVSFHGPTSLFQLPRGLTEKQLQETYSGQAADGRKERLVNNAWRERAFEQLSTIPEPFQYLLDSHWCWIQPLFNFVYRPAFTRDMKMRGPYYSDAILNAVLSHSVRWCKHEPKVAQLLDECGGGAQFFEQATNLTLASVRDGDCSIPVIQSLLLLSAQHCGRGNRTQAWLYSGMAFRLVEDLGITIDSQKYVGCLHFSDEDIEIRNRLFWSCYFWDKLISLYFGRAPLIQDTPVSPPRLLLDDTAEIDSWTPHGVIFPEGMLYPPTQAHSTSCFMRICSLSEILNQIITHIYDPLRRSGETEMHTLIRDQSHKLRLWWDELQPFLKLNVQEGAKQEDNDANPLVQCITSATSIIVLYDLYRRTFGDTHVILSLAYSVYTASSIFLLHIQALKCAQAPTLDRLRYCVHALERVKTANPVMKTALDLIYRELRKLNIDITEPQNPSQPQTVPSPPFVMSSSLPPSSIGMPSSEGIDASRHGRQQTSVGMHGVSAPLPLQSQHVDYAIPPPGVFSFASPSLVAGEQLTPPPVHVPVASDLVAADGPKIDSMNGMPDFDITPELFAAFSYVDPQQEMGVTSTYNSAWPSSSLGKGI
ncbi:hypothetical protein KEM52_006260 [Ascosphaera acerosa]|nr:hypothetical protein KEM52_006260 [Ascosphaera acerosa]